jgi:hypothetical protein
MLARDLAKWRLWRQIRRLAVVGAVLLLIGSGVAAWSDPDGKYRIQSELAVWQFSVRGKIEPVSKGDASIPAHVVRRGARKTKITTTADGVCIDNESHVCMVEFLRRVPSRRYRITARVRLDTSYPPFGRCGVYFNYAPIITQDVRSHYAHVAHFQDEAAGPPRANGAWKFVPCFDAIFTKNSWDSEQYYAHHRFLGAPPTIPYDREKTNVPVRKIVITVDGPLQTVTFVDDKTDALVLRSDMPPTGVEAAVRIIQGQTPDVAVESMTGGSGVGIFVYRAKCTVLTFRVEKMSE